MMIRQETSGDYAAVRQVVAAAFGSDVEAQLVEDIRASDHFVPELSLVAEDGESIVGHVMVSFVWLDTPAGRHRVPSLSPLAVEPSRQGRGIGSSLVRSVCAAAEERGEPLIVLEGSPAYYSRFGFEDCRRHGLTIALPEWAPPEAGQVLRLRNYDSNLRGRVVYPPAFDAATHDDGRETI